jgi:MFS family permease
VVNVALAALARDLGAGPAELPWTINAYLLPLGALILLGGGAGDHFGRRRLFLLGLAIFTLASLQCSAPRLPPCLGCWPAAACKGWVRRSCRTASRSSAPHSPARCGDGRSAAGRRREVFGAIYDLTDYRWTFGTATADFLAGNIVSNDLAGAAWPRCHVGRRLR